LAFGQVHVGDKIKAKTECCEFESSSGEVYSIQHYVIKFVSDGGFLRVLRFLPPIKLIVTI